MGRVGSVADVKIAPGGSASVFVLHEGYVGRDGDDGRVAGTVTLILDGDAVSSSIPGWSPPARTCWPRWPRTGRRPGT
jgi:hypothetical protein